MEVEYLYCPNCGYEENHIYVEYLRTCASGDLVACPGCGGEVQLMQDDSGDNHDKG